jgi:raffinose/stachyose/melibiose transport system substrate-binding protein
MMARGGESMADTESFKPLDLTLQDWSRRDFLRTAGLSIAGLGLFGVTACGSSSGPAPSSSAGTVSGTIKLLETNTTGTLWPTLISDFQKANPKVAVEGQYLPGNQLSQLLLTEFQAGNAPDVFHVNAGGGTPTNVWPLADQGRIVSLNDQLWATKVYPPLKKWVSYKGSVYAMPGSIYAVGLFYNKAIFSSLNVQPPHSFADLLTLCKTIKAAGKVPISLSLDATGASNATLWAQQLMTQYVYAVDANWTDKRLKKQVTFKSSQLWQTALSRFLQLKDAGAFTSQPLGTSLQQQITAFAKGDAAMTLLASVQLGQILQVNPNLSYGMFVVPGDSTQTTLVPLGTAITVVVNKASQSIEAAKKFVDFLAQPAQTALIAKLSGGIDPAAAAQGQLAPEFSLLDSYFRSNRTMYQPFAAWPNNNMIFGTVFPGFQGLFTGQKTPAQLLDDMDKTWDNGPQTVPGGP